MAKIGGEESYGWVLVFVCFTTGIMVVDSSVSLGIFMIESVEREMLSEIPVTLIGSCRITLAGISGMVLGGLTQKYGHRRVLVAGTLLVFFGHSGCAIWPQLGFFWILATYGVMSGIGFGCYSLVFATAFQAYFKKRRGLANAIVSTGYSCGIFFWPPVLEAFVSSYGWTGGLLMSAALHLHGLALAMLIMPKRSNNIQTPINDTKREDTDNIVGINHDENDYVLSHQSSGCQHGKTYASLPNLSENLKVTEYHDLYVFRSLPHDEFKMLAQISLESTINISDNKSNNQTKSMTHTLDYESSNNKHALVGNTNCERSPNCCSIVNNLIDFSLLKDIPFLTYCIGIVLVQGGALGPLSLLPVRALEVGINKSQAAFLLVILGVINGLFKLPWGCAADIKQLEFYKPLFCGIPAILSGMTSFLSSIATGYVSFVFLSCSWGILSAAYSSLQYALVVHVLNGRNISKGVGIIHTLLGIAWTVCLVLSGILMEHSGGAVMSFHALGAIQFIGGLLIVSIPILQRLSTHHI